MKMNKSWSWSGYICKTSSPVTGSILRIIRKASGVKGSCFKLASSVSMVTDWRWLLTHLATWDTFNINNFPLVVIINQKENTASSFFIHTVYSTQPYTLLFLSLLMMLNSLVLDRLRRGVKFQSAAITSRLFHYQRDCSVSIYRSESFYSDSFRANTIRFFDSDGGKHQCRALPLCKSYTSCCQADKQKHCFLFSTEYFTDLEGRKEQDPSLHWDFYSSSLFGKKPWESSWICLFVCKSVRILIDPILCQFQFVN